MRKRPIRPKLHEATEPPADESSLDTKLFYLRNNLELADILDGIVMRDSTYSDAEHNSGHRYTASMALECVLDFLKSAGFSSVTLKRLSTILRELNEGHVHPLLTPPKIPHRKADSLSTLKRKAVAAAAMQLYMDAGASKDKAASKVAKALQKTLFHSYGGKPISARTIANWRDRYVGCYDNADPAAYAFQRLLDMMRGSFPTPTKQAEGVFAYLQRI